MSTELTLIVKRATITIFKEKHSAYKKKKNIHLVKPFLFSTSNGKIVDVFGLHEATKNDAHKLTDYRIAASLINRFFKRLYLDQDDKRKIIDI